MTERIVLSFNESRSSAGRKKNEPSYWEASNHSSDSLLRVENWRTPQIQALCLPTSKTAGLRLTSGFVNAILRYREELKMYAALEQKDGYSPLTDPVFLDAQDLRMKIDWLTGQRKQWWDSISAFRDNFNQIMEEDFPSKKVFIKLSVRSPKDAVFCLSSIREMIHSEILSQTPILEMSDPNRLSEDLKVLKKSAWSGLCVSTSDDMLRLLTRSDRIYLDLLQAELFSQGKEINLNLHISEYYMDMNPDFEFRGFCHKGKKTCLSAYNPWVYYPSIVQNKDLILSTITPVWDAVMALYEGDDYCLDFALSPDFTRAYLIEINNFLPPLAGSGMFNVGLASDRDIILNGPFEFRIRSSPVQPNEMIQQRRDEVTGEVVSTIQFSPAPPDVMAYVEQCRLKALGRGGAARGTKCAIM